MLPLIIKIAGKIMLLYGQRKTSLNIILTFGILQMNGLLSANGSTECFR